MDREHSPHPICGTGNDARYRLRYATPRDIPEIRDLERRSGEPFRDIGLDVIADDDPPDEATLHAAVLGHSVLGHAVFVVEDGGDNRRTPGGSTSGRTPPTGQRPDPARRPLIAWMWLSVVDGDVLVEQVSVDPGYRGQRIGAGLLRTAVECAARHGLPGVVLTTFRDVPWNGPLYRRQGFTDMRAETIGPELRTVRCRETASGLDVLPRVCLRLDTSGIRTLTPQDAVRAPRGRSPAR